MGKLYMGVILGLIIIALQMVVSISCNIDKDSYVEYKYQKRIIADSLIIDTLIVNVLRNKNSIVYKMPQANKIRFKVDNNTILLKNEKCKQYAKVIELYNKKHVNNSCEIIYPFLGEYTIWLDFKIYKVDNVRYDVHKIYNGTGDSYIWSSTAFWIEDFGIVLVKLKEGRYLELVVDKQNDSKKIKKIIKNIKKDTSFSELWTIPTPPPPPK